MKIRNLFGAALLSLAAGAQAQPAVTPSAPIAADSAMLATLTRLYPATTFKEVNTTTVPGVFEVVMGQNIAYTDRTGRYFFFGRLFDMQTQSDLTAAKAEQASRLDVGALPIEDAIKTVKGSGARKLYVFSDPDCPYCQQLERNLAGINDVTIYTFMMPLDTSAVVGVLCQLLTSIPSIRTASVLVPPTSMPMRMPCTGPCSCCV